MMNIFITGGAGFIGCNAAKRFMDDGHHVTIFDNLSREGTDLNLKWLKTQGKLNFVKGDIRNFSQLGSAIRRAKAVDVVLHLAAQVAVTTSVTDPRNDFEINALGSFNVCEAVRTLTPEAILLYASTNKVYGDMKDTGVSVENKRYSYKELRDGISESYPLNFHSPYGCSKGTADQYVKDYANIYGIRTVNFRQSCIYGYRQMGMEDQGWVIWFIICALLKRPLTIYGDGMQVRDILFIDDLVDCYKKAIDRIAEVSGQSYNIGGGIKNTISLFELIQLLEEIVGDKIKHVFSDWRPGDQKIFVCDVHKAKDELGWEPVTGTRAGAEKTVEWAKQNLAFFKKLYG